MANKKFYYRNKNKAHKTEAAVDVAADVTYTPEQLSRTLEDIGIGEATRNLLEKYNFHTAADLVKSTEKDMFRVQGFNKKMLFEVKDALKAAEMSLRKEKPKAQTAEKQKGGQKPAKNQQKAAENTDESRASKFGLADRRSDGKQKQQKQPKQKQPQQKQPQPQRPAKPEKLTEPLTIENWRKVMKGGKWGFSDGFKIVVPTMYDEIFCFKEGLASVEIDGKCGYIDGENNIVIPFDYDTAMSFSEGFAMVVKGDKCGYINKNNEVVIPFEYDAATPFEGGEAKVKKDGKWATLTPDNKLVWI